MNLEVLRNMIFDEYTSLLYIIELLEDENNQEVSKRIDRCACFDLKKFTPIEHLPNFDGKCMDRDYNGKFNYLEWRQSKNLLNIKCYISDDVIHRLNLQETENKNLNDATLNYLEIKNKLMSQHIVKEIKKNIKLYNIPKHIDSCCIELPISRESVIFISTLDTEKEQLFYLIHELGHAITNFQKHKKGWQFHIEADEFFAHCFEYLIIENICDSMGKNEEELFRRIYCTYNIQRLRNSVIYSRAFLEFLELPQISDMEVYERISSILENIAYKFRIKNYQERLLVRDENKEVHTLLEFLCYSTMYIIPQSAISRILHNQQVSLKYRDIVHWMEQYSCEGLLDKIGKYLF